ncbi:MAG: arylsulfatase [Saprospiraceae bacterium]|nr:arylsulfatase [Saprospiraceae bacterium]
MHKDLIILFCGVFCFWSCQVKQKERELSHTPNIVMILSDDQGWGDLSISGNSNLQTPNIDMIAKNGAIFDRFYVCPVCSPTRAEMLTGRFHARGGVYSTSAGGERLDLDEKTIAQVFKENGYKTAAFGKWHNGMQYPYHPNARGFDEFYGFCSGHWGDYFSPMLEHNGAIVKGDGFLTDDLTEHAMHYIEEFKDSAFFLYLPLNIPHSPMQVPDEYWNRFKDKKLILRGSDSLREDTQHTKAALAMCENIDWNVGRVIKKLDETGLLHNTIVLYFSDNGPNGHRWNGGMRGIKGSTDEGGVRSPLMIQWPGKISPGTKITQLTSAPDLLPTLVDLAGIRFIEEKPLDGMSLRPLLLNEDTTWPDRLFFHNWAHKTSVRSQQFLLDYQGRLFDMEKDPGQHTDISAELPEVAEKLGLEKEIWEGTVLTELPDEDNRPFPVGHPDFLYTQLPARDAQAFGNIQRSNKYPNCSYFSNWLSVSDSIVWDVEVLAEGTFAVEIYYTAKQSSVGSTFELKFNDDKLVSEIKMAHDPPETGMEHDRVNRAESYIKDFIPLQAGEITLHKGAGKLILKAVNIKGSELMDFRLLMLQRIPSV